MALYNQQLAQVRHTFYTQYLCSPLIDRSFSQAESVPLPEEDDDL
jgi:hypothetical protein